MRLSDESIHSEPGELCYSMKSAVQSKQSAIANN